MKKLFGNMAFARKLTTGGGARRKPPRLAAAAAALAATMVLVGCGSGPSADDGVVNLRMAWYGGEGRHKLYNEILDRFEAENPNIKVSRESSEWGAYWERIGTQTAAKSAPDVMHFTNMQLREFATAGQLLDLKKYTDDGTLKLNDFDDQLLQSGQVDGTTFAVPTGFLALSTVANTTMLEEAGVSLPETYESWTWDEFKNLGRDAAPRLGEDRWFTGDFGGSTRVLKAYLMGKGKELFDVDQEPAKLGFERKDLAEWLTFWEDLRKEGVAPPAKITAEQTGLPFEDQMFSKDQTAIHLHANNTLTNHEKYTKGNLELKRMPNASTDGPPADYFFSVTMAISANSKHPAEAAKLVNYFMTDQEAAKIYSGEFGPPASSKSRSTIREQQDSEDLKVSSFADGMLDLGLVSDQAWPRGGVLLNDGLLARANEQVAFGKSTPEQAADAFFNEAESALK